MSAKSLVALAAFAAVGTAVNLSTQAPLPLECTEFFRDDCKLEPLPEPTVYAVTRDFERCCKRGGYQDSKCQNLTSEVFSHDAVTVSSATCHELINLYNKYNITHAPSLMEEQAPLPLDVLHAVQSPYQSIQVVRGKHGPALMLDGVLQLSELGEASYHEMMAHSPLFALERPAQTVLVIGGGDGGVTLRVLQHRSVKRVVQVELDREVVATAKTFFPELAAAFDDPRVELYHDDAIAWSEREALKHPGSFDAVIIDSTDDPLLSPWTSEFYSSIRQLLKPHGLLMQNIQNLDNRTQLGRALELQSSSGFSMVHPMLLNTFDYGANYVAFLSSVAQRCAGPAPWTRSHALATNWYSAGTHRAALAMPPWLGTAWPQLAQDADGCKQLLPAALDDASDTDEDYDDDDDDDNDDILDNYNHSSDQAAFSVAIDAAGSFQPHRSLVRKAMPAQVDTVPCPFFYLARDKEALKTIGDAETLFNSYCVMVGHTAEECRGMCGVAFKDLGEMAAPFEPGDDFCEVLYDLKKIHFHLQSFKHSHLEQSIPSTADASALRVRAALTLAAVSDLDRAALSKGKR